MRRRMFRMPVNNFGPSTRWVWFLAFLLAGIWSGLLPRTAAAQDDPFAQTPKANAKPPAANAPGSPAANPTADRIDFAVSVTPKEAKRGGTVKLTITGTPRPGFHTYPLTQRADNPFQDELALSKIIIDNTPGLQPLWPVKESEPSLKQEQGIGYFLEHENPFTWSQDILILPEATPGPKTLKFRIRLQVCDQTCVWGEHPFEERIAVSSDPA